MPYPTVDTSELKYKFALVLDELSEALTTYLSVEHNNDGTHKGVTAETLAVTGAVTIGPQPPSGTFPFQSTGDFNAQLLRVWGEIDCSTLYVGTPYNASSLNLSVQGMAAITSHLSLTGGDLLVNTNKLTVAGATGSVNINLGKFTVDGATGNTVIAGTINSALTVTSNALMTLTAPAAQNSKLRLSSPSIFASSIEFNQASTNIWTLGFNITGSTQAFELYNTANAAAMLTVTANALATLTAPASQNAQVKVESIASNGFGAQLIAKSKTSGGVTNTWNAGTGVTGAANAFEFFNDGFAAAQLTLEIGGRCTFGSVLRMKGYTVATLPAGSIGDHAYVTDALAPTFLAAVVGGGAIKTPVFYDGSNWIGA